MYTLKLLAPFLTSTCINSAIHNTPVDLCSFDTPARSVVKYYQPGKSCYVNGTFYRDCKDAE